MRLFHPSCSTTPLSLILVVLQIIAHKNTFPGSKFQKQSKLRGSGAQNLKITCQNSFLKRYTVKEQLNVCTSRPLLHLCIFHSRSLFLPDWTIQAGHNNPLLSSGKQNIFIRSNQTFTSNVLSKQMAAVSDG